jgi:hypothetical protein
MSKLFAAAVASVLGFASGAFAQELKFEDGQGLPEGMKAPERAAALVEKVTKVGDAGFVVAVHTQTVVADGEVLGTGWSDGRLEWVDEVQIPENTDRFLDFLFTAVPPTPAATGGATPISANRISSNEEITASDGVRVWSKTNCIQMPWAGGSTEMSLTDCRAAATAQTLGFESPQLKALGLQLDKPLLIPTLKDVTMAPFSTAMDGRISVRATGTTPTVDWLDPHLMAIDSHESSADKYIDLTFLIVPPHGETGVEDVTHKAEKTFMKDEQGTTTGVRLWAENGCIELDWTAATSATVKPFSDCIKSAGLVPVP